MRLDLIAVCGELMHIEVRPIQRMVGGRDNRDVVLMHNAVGDHLLFYDIVERVQDPFLEFPEWMRRAGKEGCSTFL